MPEKHYYPSIERYLRRRFGCYVTGQNRGTKYGRVDVIGIRDTGGELSGESEVIGVEVKAGGQPFNTATGQAYGYSIYAERCYLADFRDGPTPFTLEELDIASKLGVGLLAIRPTGTVHEVLSSPQHHPLPHMRSQIVEKLGYSLCTICHSMFKRSERGKPDANVRRSISKAYDAEKGLVFWLDEVNKRRKRPYKYNYVRRYVCPDCITNLYDEVLLEGDEVAGA